MTPDVKHREQLPPLRVTVLANGGVGLAHHQGQVVFIPDTAPGDLVRVQVRRVKKRYIEAYPVAILERAPGRRDPPCPVAGECGGCQWQHLPYREQLFWKERLFRETLVRTCGVAEDRIRPIIPAPDQWHYRSRVQVKCHRTEAGLVTGFYRRKSRFVVAMESCPIMAEPLNDLLCSLRELLTGTGFAGQIPQLDLTLDDRGRRSAIVHYLGGETDALARHLSALEDPTDLLIQPGRATDRFRVRGSGRHRLLVDNPPLDLEYGSGSFVQVNLAQNRQLIAKALDLIDWQGSETAVDLYCGMGNFTCPLGRRAARVIGIEETSAGVEAGRNNARQHALRNLEFQCRPAEGALPGIAQREKIDVLYLDPPRSGAYGVSKDLLKTPVPRVVYISCDPQTLARDLQPLLHGGYRLVSSQPCDMFPQTFHCESMTLLHYRG